MVGVPVDDRPGGPTRRGHVGGGGQVGERENLVQRADHEQPAKEGGGPDDHHPTTGGFDQLVNGLEGVESGCPHEADMAQLDAQIGGAVTDKVGDDRADGVGVGQVELAVKVDLRPGTDPGHVDHGCALPVPAGRAQPVSRAERRDRAERRWRRSGQDRLPHSPTGSLDRTVVDPVGR